MQDDEVYAILDGNNSELRTHTLFVFMDGNSGVLMNGGNWVQVL